MPTREAPRWPPPWFRCEVCGLGRAGHDRLNGLVAEPDRHAWVSAQQARRASAHHAANQPLPINNPKE